MAIAQEMGYTNRTGRYGRDPTYPSAAGASADKCAAHMQNEYSLKPTDQTNEDSHQEHPCTKRTLAATVKPEIVVSVGMT